MTPRRRRASVLAIVALAALATLALAPAASATYPARNGLIAFHVEGGQNGPQIFTVRPNGKQLRQITHVDGAAALPDWSPDGQRIVFTLNECAIGVMDADGGNLHEVASDAGACLNDANYTPDGARFVFTRFDFALEVEQIWSMKPDGSDKKFVADGGGADPNVSPDGRKLSFKSQSTGALLVQNMDGTGLVQVSPTVSVAYKHDWAPNGQHLVLSDNSDPGPTEPVNIATVRPDGTDFHYLTHYTGPIHAYVGSYSPDGQWILFRLEKDGLNTLYRIRPDGTDLHAILRASTFRPRNIDWGPATHN